MFELTEVAPVQAPVDEVWRDFTDAGRLADWVWPPRFETEARVDVRVRGGWSIRSQFAALGVEAMIVELEPEHRLRLAWRWDGESHVTDAEITLDPTADAATRVTVRHTGFRTDEERVNHIEGWSNCLQRLVERHSRR